MPSPEATPDRPARPAILVPDDHDDHDDFGGFLRDRRAMARRAVPDVGRRGALRLLGGVGLVTVVAACGNGGNADPSPAGETGASTSGADASGPGTEIPDETAGPFPADGTNGPNLLSDGAVVRPDITTSIGDYSGTAEGTPTSIQLTVVDADTGTPIEGAAVYLWHCTAGGQYSLYEETDQNYLRGVQVCDAAGRVSFTTVFPGCYRGRWPHAHFEVFDDIESADDGRAARKTSQLALPQADCEVVFADAAYGDSADNLSRLSLASDGVFADGWTDQLATIAIGDVITVSLLVRV